WSREMGMARSEVGAGALQPAILALVVMLFVVSPNLLHAMGAPYSASHGPQWTKIHPAFYAVVGLVAAQACRRSSRSRTAVQMASLALAGTVLLAILVVTLSSTTGSGGGELSALIVTFLLPAFFALAMAH